MGSSSSNQTQNTGQSGSSRINYVGEYGASPLTALASMYTGSAGDAMGIRDRLLGGKSYATAVRNNWQQLFPDLFAPSATTGGGTGGGGTNPDGTRGAGPGGTNQHGGDGSVPKGPDPTGAPETPGIYPPGPGIGGGGGGSDPTPWLPQEYSTARVPTAQATAYAHTPVSEGGGEPSPASGGAPTGTTTYINPYTGETRDIPAGTSPPAGWVPVGGSEHMALPPGQKPIITAGGPVTGRPDTTAQVGPAANPSGEIDPSGGLIGSYEALMGSLGYDPATWAAIQRSIGESARGATDAAQSDLNRKYAASGNAAGYYGARSALGSSQQQAMSKAMEDAQIQRYGEQQRQRELGLAGEAGLLGLTDQEIATYLGGASNILTKPVGTGSTSSGFAAGSGSGSSFDWASLIPIAMMLFG